jgi:hypothetical protein
VLLFRHNDVEHNLQCGLQGLESALTQNTNELRARLRHGVLKPGEVFKPKSSRSDSSKKVWRPAGNEGTLSKHGSTGVSSAFGTGVFS